MSLPVTILPAERCITCNVGPGVGLESCTVAVKNLEAGLASREHPLMYPGPVLENVLRIDGDDSKLDTNGGEQVIIQGQNFGSDPACVNIRIGGLPSNKGLEITQPHRELKFLTPQGVWRVYPGYYLVTYCWLSVFAQCC